jgi:penicillin-insensitive murein endopeptidase
MRAILLACAVPVALFAGFAAYIEWRSLSARVPSICHGTVARGSLEGGQRPPYSGENYRAYSLLGYLAGRTFVHSAVRDTMVDAYAAVARQHPELHFVYAETGWPWGGRFAPHRSHANGTAVDFLVPVRTLDGSITEMPTAIWNQYGYSVEFDKAGRAGSIQIDFEAMAIHLLALHDAAHAHGIGIQRVIFDPPLQPLLFATKSGARLRGLVTFSPRPAWIRHDEHYHVDFAVRCR